VITETDTKPWIKYHTEEDGSPLIQGSDAWKAAPTYNRLTYIRELDERGIENRRLSLWQCECGETTKAPRGRVVSGATKSCGCMARESKPSLAHGMKYTKEYNTWAAIKARCHNPKNKDFPKYGARGVVVCTEWRNSFESFWKCMGSAPTSKHQIDRINTLGNYEPGNCRWATAQEQCRNTVSACDWYIKGIHFETAKEAGVYFRVTEQTIHRWVKGYFDARRGTQSPPKASCMAVYRYPER